VDPKVGEGQVRRLRELKERRDHQAVQAALARLEAAAKGSDNLMPCILDAVRAYATLGEVCGVLRKVFGVYSDLKSR
jgi:methylmalonyl-CoA mutase N-terminal domain/subunit